MEAEPTHVTSVRRRMRALWLVMGSAPLLLAGSEGAGNKTLAATAAWGIGAVLVGVALRRDPEASALATVRAAGAGFALGAIGFVALQVAALVFPATMVILAALLGALAFVVAWAACGPGPGLARLARCTAWIVGSLGALVAAGEIFCRLPPVVAWTGGHRPGIIRFERERYDGLWQRNPLRLRSRHVDAPKPAGVRQLLVLGDDATFGTLVASTDDTWPAVLEDDLTRRGVSVQIVNAGQRYFTTANEAEWLARVGFRFEPDALLVQFGLNDAVRSTPGFGAEGSFSFIGMRPLLPGLSPYLSTRSYLYSALDSFKEHQEMRHLHPEGYRPLYEDGAVGWQQAQQALVEMGAWARTRRVPALLVLFPDLEPDTRLAPGAYRYEGVHERVRRAAEAAGFSVLDLWPAFAAAGRPPEAWWALPCEPTFGVEAQRLAAQAIGAEIERLGWLDAIQPGEPE